MKIKRLLALLLVVMVFAFSACKPDQPGTDSTGGGQPETVLPTDIPAATEPTMQIHYKRNNQNDYLKWGFWLWSEGKEGELYTMNYQDDFGGVAVYPMSVLFDNFTGTEKIGMIPRLLTDWVKDVDEDREWDLSQFEMDENNFYHVYITQGDKELYMTDELIITPKIKNAVFATEKAIVVTASVKINNAKIYENGALIAEQKLANVKSGRITLASDFAPDFTAVYTVEVTYSDQGTTDTSEVSMSGLYSSDTFNDLYYYDGELGAIYTKESTTFRVWSPFSTQITLNIYEKGAKTAGETPATQKMTKGDKGVYEVTVSGDLAGKYYTYTVVNNKYPDGKEIVDPYAKSAGVNGVRGQIVDFSQTNPQGWDQVSAKPYDRKELVVWETHVADVTSSATWTGTEAYRKKFLGMAESGTTYTQNGVTVKTGFDHIKELGVNAVQIIPIFDQANDEVNTEFNWGYNPVNYNVLEGAYATDPTDGYVRINEFKQLVKAYNEAGINIIMDVVYNHVNGLEGSNFDVLMPNYYFRYTSEGKASNGSGCGNETASENLMYRKFMIDSVTFWAKEYKLGGFRFDLMGLHDIETMNLLTEKLKEVNPNIVVYGEPWMSGTSTLPSSQQAVQVNANNFVGFGQFNDQMRDALIKGGMSGVEELGWVTNSVKISNLDVSKIVKGIQGVTAGTLNINDPNKTVNYVTCHDNYTLYDRINAAGITDEETVRKMALLANSVVLTSQGTTFMLAGEEFLRTKGGSHNSYNESYKVNELDYALKIKNNDIFVAYQKLIALKKSTASMHLEEADMANYDVTSQAGGSVIAIKFTSEGKAYEIYHANGTVAGVEIATEGMTLYLDTLNPQATAFDGSKIQLQPYQTIITYKTV